VRLLGQTDPCSCEDVAGAVRLRLKATVKYSTCRKPMRSAISFRDKVSIWRGGPSLAESAPAGSHRGSCEPTSARNRPLQDSPRKSRRRHHFLDVDSFMRVFADELSRRATCTSSTAVTSVLWRAHHFQRRNAMNLGGDHPTRRASIARAFPRPSQPARLVLGCMLERGGVDNSQSKSSSSTPAPPPVSGTEKPFRLHASEH
jgi:hypothetical protein